MDNSFFLLSLLSSVFKVIRKKDLLPWTLSYALKLFTVVKLMNDQLVTPFSLGDQLFFFGDHLSFVMIWSSCVSPMGELDNNFPFPSLPDTFPRNQIPCTDHWWYNSNDPGSGEARFCSPNWPTFDTRGHSDRWLSDPLEASATNWPGPKPTTLGTTNTTTILKEWKQTCGQAKDKMVLKEVTQKWQSIHNSSTTDYGNEWLAFSSGAIA